MRSADSLNLEPVAYRRRPGSIYGESEDYRDSVVIAGEITDKPALFDEHLGVLSIAPGGNKDGPPWLITQMRNEIVPNFRLSESHDDELDQITSLIPSCEVGIGDAVLGGAAGKCAHGLCVTEQFNRRNLQMSQNRTSNPLSSRGSQVTLQSAFIPRSLRTVLVVRSKDDDSGSLAAHMANAAAVLGRKLLLVDMDPWAMLSAAFPNASGVPGTLQSSHLYRASVAGLEPEELRPGLFLARADGQLRDPVLGSVAAAKRLRSSIDTFSPRFDACVIEISDEGAIDLLSVPAGICVVVAGSVDASKAGAERFKRLAAAVEGALESNPLLASKLSFLTQTRKRTNNLNDKRQAAPARRLVDALLEEMEFETECLET